MKTKQKPKPKAKTHAIVKRKEPEQLRLPEKIEQALIQGNLINLSAEERVSLVMATCKSLHLNPLTNPFIYILVSDWENDTERMILYASRNCTDQLRMIHRVTEVNPIEQWEEDGMLMARAFLRDRTGRQASDLGAIPKKRYSKKKGSFYELSGAQLANAKMHVGTKATRRATLKLVGLGGGIVDESELDTMNVIGGVTPDGRIFRYEQPEGTKTPREQAEAIKDEKIKDLSQKAANATPSQPAAPKAPIVREVEIRSLVGDEFAVTGYLEDIQVQQYLSDTDAKGFKANEDGRTWWRMKTEYLEDFKKLCAKLELKIK